MKNKADLYKLSSPHNTQIFFDNKVEFRALIGTYENNHTITVEAYNLKLALQEAWTHCRNYELVLQIMRNGKIIWNNEFS
jgi:hypothetical protein